MYEGTSAFGFRCFRWHYELVASLLDNSYLPPHPGYTPKESVPTCQPEFSNRVSIGVHAGLGKDVGGVVDVPFAEGGRKGVHREHLSASNIHGDGEENGMPTGFEEGGERVGEREEDILQ